jgi:hypothetical protein
MPKSKAVAVKKQGTSIATIDEQLSKEIADIKERLGQPGGNKISLEPSGEFVLPDGTNVGKTIKLVVVDFLSVHRWYDKGYVKGVITAPVCFAHGKKITTMAPDDRSKEKQADTCASCWANAFGTGQNGKSKACKQSRDAAVLWIDDENPDASTDDAPLLLFSCSASNIKAFDAAVSRCLTTLGHPIKAIFEITGHPEGTYASISIVVTPNPNYGEHAQRLPEAEAVIVRIPNYEEVEAQSKGKAAPPRRAQGQPRKPSSAMRR